MKSKRRSKRVRFYVWIPGLFVVCLWPASYGLRDRLDVFLAGHEMNLRNGTGWVSVRWAPSPRNDFSLKNSFGPMKFDPAEMNYPKVYPAPGEFYFYSPTWVLAVVATVAATSVTFVQGYKRPGTCGSCGYDMRATPGRCPECGTPA